MCLLCSAVCPQAFPLRYTPRRLSVNPDTKRVAIVEADHNAFSLAQKKELKRLAVRTRAPLHLLR